ncbi:hypothetical protein [Pseudomonas alloputida]|uniref:hypothetical protein n=1 Tax=Pseudomonas alloputida TaxID=1940621 RepID=UPI001E62E131|nr:hypothetical protein [Pseudomonas alloputida]MCE1054125.1 hypothetical protein [Pseudomonas alloputida]
MNGYLYRYSSARHNESLMKAGSLRIGTLFDFRRSEHKAGIADPTEGMKTVYHHVDHWDADSEIPGHPSKHMRAMSEVGMFQFTGSGGGGGMYGITLARQLDSPDYFIHCSAWKLSHTVMKQFEGAETCVEIVDPMGFYGHITQSLNAVTPVKFEGLFRIKYTDRHEQWNGMDYGLSGCLIKEREFKEQCEVRAIWSPVNGQPIAPQIIENPNLARHCRRRL